MDNLEKIKSKLVVDLVYNLETSTSQEDILLLGSSWIIWKWSDSLVSHIAKNFEESKFPILSQASAEEVTDSFCQILDSVGLEYDVGRQISEFKDRSAISYVVSSKKYLTTNQVEKIRSFAL